MSANLTFYGNTVNGTESKGTVTVEYSVKYSGPHYLATVEYEVSDGNLNMTVTSMGNRKVRATKIEQERMFDVYFAAKRACVREYGTAWEHMA